jgi:hypothetical protein
VPIMPVVIMVSATITSTKEKPLSLRLVDVIIAG